MSQLLSRSAVIVVQIQSSSREDSRELDRERINERNGDALALHLPSYVRATQIKPSPGFISLREVLREGGTILERSAQGSSSGSCS